MRRMILDCFGLLVLSALASAQSGPLTGLGKETDTTAIDPTSKPTATPYAFVWPKPDRRAVARVSPVHGIPRLSINGTVVPPVMFFGNTDMNARYAVIEEELLIGICFFTLRLERNLKLHSLPGLGSSRCHDLPTGLGQQTVREHSE